MPDRIDFKARRLYVRAGLVAGAEIELDRGQVNYLVNVLRMKEGDGLLVFNGKDGEWRARLASEGRRAHRLEAVAQIRAQPDGPDLHYLFAPLKQARLDYMVEKAVEMGVARLRPVLTQHGQVGKVNLERMEANAIEAAEQCGILTIPAVDLPVALGDVLSAWEAAEGGRQLVFCDEGHAGENPLAILSRMAPGPLAVLVGPEGGFSAAERADLTGRPFVTPIPLGPRILRADTAAVAALALVQAVLGDWKSS